MKRKKVSISVDMRTKLGSPTNPACLMYSISEQDHDQLRWFDFMSKAVEYFRKTSAYVVPRLGSAPAFFGISSTELQQRLYDSLENQHEKKRPAQTGTQKHVRMVYA